MMSIDPERFWREVARGEDTALELRAVRLRGEKVTSPHRDGLADAFAAFGNASGGRLVLGVRNDRSAQSLGPPQLDALMRLVEEACTDGITPPLDYEAFRVPAPKPGVRGVLLVDIPESGEVHRAPSGYLQWKGDATWRMDARAVRRLSHDRRHADASPHDARVVRGTGVDALERDLWRRYLSSWVEDPPEISLAKLRFVKADSAGTLRATVAGVLLATKEPRVWLPGAWIEAICYRGDRPDAELQLDASDITGPLDEQIREATRFVVRNRWVAAFKDPARTDVPQFSERAVFEAVVNAVVHRDYRVRGSHIRLLLFEGRLELQSPGGLSNCLKPEDLRTNQSARNELLASRLGQCVVGDVPGAGGRRYFMDRRGGGIRVIEDETRALAGRPPVFELLGERELRVVLPAARPPVAGGVAARVTTLREEGGKPLADAHVLMLCPNGTYREARTNSLGEADFVLHSRLAMTVLCAAEGFRAHVERDHLPDGPLEVVMRAAPEGGSLILPDQAGNLPGIQGRMNPILDNLDRAYLYAHNVAINDGQAQPVHFALNEPVRLTDSLGARATLWFREMVGASCIFDYEFDRG